MLKVQKRRAKVSRFVTFARLFAIELVRVIHYFSRFSVVVRVAAAVIEVVATRGLYFIAAAEKMLLSLRKSVRCWRDIPPYLINTFFPFTM